MGTVIDCDQADDYECHCECHTHPDEVDHCMPCCEQCIRCGMNIKKGCMDMHLAKIHGIADSYDSGCNDDE